VDDEKAMSAAKKTLAQVMALMEGEAVRNCPADTGRLRGSIHTHKVSDFHYILADGVNYGVYVEFGTSPHMILPRKKKALKFQMDGRDVFARKVSHPGTNAQPFMRPALDYGKRIVGELYERNMGKGINS
jgi:HK97 gp10 family phage protein